MQAMKKITILLIFLILPLVFLSAVSSVTSVAGMQYLSDFAFGNFTSFPASVTIRQGADDLALFDDVKTDMAMIMDFGLTQRNITQNLVNGNFLAEEELGKAKYGYSVFYSAIRYSFDNAFLKNELTDDYLLKASVSLNVRFEQAFESLTNLRSGDASIINPNFEDSVYSQSAYTEKGKLNSVSTPDINKNGYLFSNSISASLSVNHMRTEKRLAFQEGVQATLSFDIAPWWLWNDFSFDIFDGGSDFYKISLNTIYSKVLYSRENWKRWNKITLILEDFIDMQMLFGNKIPKYADTISFYGMKYLNLDFIIRNTFRFYVYGPNFFTENTYPYGYIFSEAGYAVGRPNNSTVKSVYNFAYMTVGIHLRLKFMGALNLYAEAAYTFSNLPSYSSPFRYGIGGYFAF